MRRLLIVLLALLLVACGGQAQPQPEEATETTAVEATTPAEEAAPTEETVGETPTTGSATTEEPTVTTQPAPASSPEQQASGARLQTILDRGSLICGVNATLPGFGIVDESGAYAGFDVDFCRAIAAALFDDPEAVEFRPLNAQERFTALQTGEVDVLIRNTTYTISRDSDVGLDFAPITFYDGQGMMVRADSGITSLEDMDGATICVQTGTTTELNLADVFRGLGIEYTPVVFAEADPTREAYDAEQCDGFTTDKSGLVASQTQLTNPEDHIILDATMSKEPLGPSVLQGDAEWADVVRWVVYATFQAEEFGITSENMEADFMASENPDIRRFLGTEGELGAALGLENDFVQRVIRGVGNYAEIYDRNLGPETPFNLPRGLNTLYTEGGLLYSPPFR